MTAMHDKFDKHVWETRDSQHSNATHNETLVGLDINKCCYKNKHNKTPDSLTATNATSCVSQEICTHRISTFYAELHLNRLVEACTLQMR